MNNFKQKVLKTQCNPKYNKTKNRLISIFTLAFIQIYSHTNFIYNISIKAGERHKSIQTARRPAEILESVFHQVVLSRR